MKGGAANILLGLNFLLSLGFSEFQAPFQINVLCSISDVRSPSVSTKLEVLAPSFADFTAIFVASLKLNQGYLDISKIVPLVCVVNMNPISSSVKLSEQYKNVKSGQGKNSLLVLYSKSMQDFENI